MFIVPLPRSAALASAYLFDTARAARFSDNARAARRSPAVDIAETDAAYTVTLDMPGVAKDDVKVSIEGRRVDIEAQTPQAAQPQDSQRIVYRERAASRYARSFTLPSELDQAQSTAKLENGVLSLTLAKRAKASTRIQIN
jgi:HSP20 family protein